MTDKKNLSWRHIAARAESVAEAIMNTITEDNPRDILLYGVPRGGVYAAQQVCYQLLEMEGPDAYLVENPKDATHIIDDIIDKGHTKASHTSTYRLPFYALVDKTEPVGDFPDQWVSFPWERMNNEDAPTENVVRLLQYIGDDPEREGLAGTPDRVIKSFDKLYGGYGQKPEDVVKIFSEGACDEMVILRDVEFYSTCEHHMLPFFGRAHIGYIPDGKVIGVSKLARILEIYARRLQIQERLCQQVTAAIEKLLTPFGAVCVLEAQHFCMTARGVEKQHSIMVTSSLTGFFKEKSETRSEFMNFINHKG